MRQLASDEYDYDWTDDPNDIGVPLRRALMIRSNLGCGYDDRLDIDEGLLHALLHAPKYTHGSRSLGRVLEPLKAAGVEHLRRSHLPPSNQLVMNVDDGTAFIGLCKQHRDSSTGRAPEAPGETELAVMARAIHETYRELGKKEGWLWEEKDRYEKLMKIGAGEGSRANREALEEFAKEQGWTEPWKAKKFEELDGCKEAIFVRDSNLAAARRMLDLLAIVDLELVEGMATPEEEADVRQHIEHHLELLAAAEHQGWMDWHFQQGWTYAPKRDNEEKHHPCLLPFSKLGDEDKNKDRTQVRHYPDFAKKAGKKIVFAEPT